MKKVIIAMFVSLLLYSCETCDSVRYQIREKKDIGSGICEYKAQSIGECLIWNDQTVIVFIDSCKQYSLSETFDRDFLYKKYK